MAKFRIVQRRGEGRYEIEVKILFFWWHSTPGLHDLCSNYYTSVNDAQRAIEQYLIEKSKPKKVIIKTF